MHLGSENTLNPSHKLLSWQTAAGDVLAELGLAAVHGNLGADGWNDVALDPVIACVYESLASLLCSLLGIHPNTKCNVYCSGSSRVVQGHLGFDGWDDVAVNLVTAGVNQTLALPHQPARAYASQAYELEWNVWLGSNRCADSPGR